METGLKAETEDDTVKPKEGEEAYSKLTEGISQRMCLILRQERERYV